MEWIFTQSHALPFATFVQTCENIRTEEEARKRDKLTEAPCDGIQVRSLHDEKRAEIIARKRKIERKEREKIDEVR